FETVATIHFRWRQQTPSQRRLSIKKRWSQAPCLRDLPTRECDARKLRPLRCVHVRDESEINRLARDTSAGPEPQPFAKRDETPYFGIHLKESHDPHFKSHHNSLQVGLHTVANACRIHRKGRPPATGGKATRW